MFRKSDADANPRSPGSCSNLSRTRSTTLSANQSPADGEHGFRFEYLPVGHVAAELHGDGLAIGLRKGFVAFVTVRYARENDDQVFFREIVDRLSGDTCTLHVQGQAEHVILVEMKGRIGLFVKPILCDEQIVAGQRGEIIQDTFHQIMRLMVTNIGTNKDKSKPGRFFVGKDTRPGFPAPLFTDPERGVKEPPW